MRFASWIVACVSLVVLAMSGAVRADCAARDAALAARKEADAADAAFRKHSLDPATLARVFHIHIRFGYFDDMDLRELHNAYSQVFAPDEVAKIEAYEKAQRERVAAEAKASHAERVWMDEFKKKDDALNPARERFEKEQQWVEEQRNALKGKPVDKDYLDQAEAIVKRLRPVYQELIKQLEPYRACYGDARDFIEDLERRMKRLDQVDADIAERRAKLGIKPPPASQPADSPFDPANDDKELGEEWELDGEPVITLHGAGVNATATGASWTEKVEGGDGTGTLKIDIAPPKRIRGGQALLLQATLARQGEYGVIGAWYANNCYTVDRLPKHSDSATDPADSTSAKQGAHNVATWHRKFSVGNAEYPVWIEFRITQWGADYSPGATIRWNYKKAGT